MNYAIAGCPIVGGLSFNTSQLDRLTRWLRKAGRAFVNTMNKRSEP